MPRVRTLRVERPEAIKDFFDALAEDYCDSHGEAERLLAYRLHLVRRLMADVGRSVLVEIGCGTGIHLFPLASEFDRVIGSDLSPKMIEVCEAVRRNHPCGARVELLAEPAEHLASVSDAVADAVLCVGALEHMPDKAAVLREVRRVLRPGGAFVCLTPNGGYLWYVFLAPLLKYDCRHLSSDRFLTASEFEQGLVQAGLEPRELGWWTFVPAGDMPVWMARILAWLDRLGRFLRVSSLRGGGYVKASKPDLDVPSGPSGG